MSPHPAATMSPGPRSSNDHTSSNDSNLSIITTRATALDVCRSIYGDNTIPVLSVDALYEANASNYENPVLTATSRSVIGDIHRLTKQFNSIDIPRPLAALYTLFRLQPPRNVSLSEPLFRALRVWTDVEDICESESFDGHRKAIIEHTLHILLLPGIHLDGMDQRFSTEPSDSLVTPTQDYPSSPSHPPSSSPWLPIPGTSLSVPSPLHFKLHIVTRLSFNEQGLVTHHRDIWDIKDVLGLMPGVSLAQWIGTRIMAAALSYASRIWARDGPNGLTAQSTDAARHHSKLPVTENETNHPKNLEDDATKASEYTHLDIWNNV